MSEALARDLQVTLKAPTCSSAEPGACRQAVQEAVYRVGNLALFSGGRGCGL